VKTHLKTAKKIPFLNPLDPGLSQRKKLLAKKNPGFCRDILTN